MFYNFLFYIQFCISNHILADRYFHYSRKDTIESLADLRTGDTDRFSIK